MIAQSETQELSWLKDVMTKFSEVHAQEKCPQAILLDGANGLGLEILSFWMAEKLLESDNKEHPDIKLIQLEEKATQVKIDQIRGLTKFLSLKAFNGPYKVGIIEAAETMNINAQNALLKTLEEPPEFTVLILIVHQKGRLLPTILSRCQVWRVEADETVVGEYLKSRYPGQDVNMLKRLCALGPLNLPSLDLVNDIVQSILSRKSPIAMAERWKNELIPAVLDILLRLVVDIQVVQAGVKPITFIEYEGKMAQFNISREQLTKVERKLLNAKEANHMGVNLNPQLLLEDILITFL